MVTMGSAVWADDEVVYTLQTEKYSSYSYYNEYHDVDINGITWNAPGNMNFTSYWRIGGGKATTAADRTITSKTPMEYAISQVTIYHQGISNASFSVQSVTLTIATEASFSSASTIETVKLTPTVSTTEGSFSLTPQKVDIWPKGCYYKLTLSYKNTSTSNAGLNFASMNFYGHVDEAETYTWKASSLGYTENTEVTTVTNEGDPIDITFAKGNGNNQPAYVLSSSAIENQTIQFERYNELSLAAKEGYAISGITIHYQSGSRNLTPSIGTYVGVENANVGYGVGTWTGCSPHVTLTNTSGVYINIISISATYIRLQEVTTETASISRVGVATFCPLTTPVVVGDGKMTSIITGKDNSNVVIEKIIPVVPVGTGVMLRGTEGTHKCYTHNLLTTPDVTTNLLVGVTTTQTAIVGTYILQYHDDEGLGFYHVEDADLVDITAGRAYLNLPPQAPGAPTRPLFFTQEDADRYWATGIHSLHAADHQSETLYSPNGTRLTAPQKGINIIRRADGTTLKKVMP